MLSLLGSAGVASPVGLRQQNGSMTISAAPPMQQRLASMAAAIHQLIPAAEVRLFGSRAQGKARPDSDVDLLITAPDAWLAQHDRFALLGECGGPWPNPISLSIWCFTPAAKWHDVPRSRDRWCMRPCATACCSMASPEDGPAAQQCLEKTLKAWIHATGSKPPATHDIPRLLLLLELAGVDTTELLPLRAFTTFAVQYRYQDEP
jgi:predicted nucleotidyltransferase